MSENRQNDDAKIDFEIVKFLVTSEYKDLFIAVDDNIRKEFQDNPISEDDAYDMFILELDKCELGLTNEVEESIFQEYVEYSELFIV